MDNQINRDPARGFLITKHIMAITDYLKGVKTELKHVNWPTRSQGINYTLVVIFLAILTAVILGGFDFIFTTILKDLII